MDTFGKSDPFIVISRLPSSNTTIKNNNDSTNNIPNMIPVEIYRSEVVKENLNPEWKQFSILVSDISAGDIIGGNVLIECFDWDAVGSNDLIGNCTVFKN